MHKPHIELKKPQVSDKGTVVKVAGSVACQMLPGIRLKVVSAVGAKVTPEFIRGTTGKFEVTVQFRNGPGVAPVVVTAEAAGGSASATFEARSWPGFRLDPYLRVYLTGSEMLNLTVPLTHTFDQRLELAVQSTHPDLVWALRPLVFPPGAVAATLSFMGRLQYGHAKKTNVTLHFRRPYDEFVQCVVVTYRHG